MDKLHSISSLLSIRYQYFPFVLTNGCFDLLHEGHIHSLKAAAKFGNLFVALNSDASVKQLKGPNRPIEDEQTRAKKLCELDYVQGVFIFKDNLPYYISWLIPDIYVKSNDYTLETLDKDEKAALIRCKAEIKFVPILPGFSTTKIIEERKCSL